MNTLILYMYILMERAKWKQCKGKIEWKICSKNKWTRNEKKQLGILTFNCQF